MTEPIGTRALEGVRVVELGQIYNGPYCGLLLAQLGAEVVKVEPPGGEPLRHRSHEPVETHEFLMLNSNKRSVVLDLKSPEGHAALLDLIANADVLIENFAPGTMDRLDLAPDRLLALNPQLIYASGKGYGSTGPYAHMAAMDITVQAMAGSVASTGDPGGPPTKSGVAFVDFSGGVHLYGAIVSALFQRTRTGRGQRVEVSMHDTVYPMLASSLGAIHNGHGRDTVPERTGNRHTGLAVAPYNIYPASDGWIGVISLSEKHWHRITDAMGRPELSDDPRFRQQKDRVAHMDELDDLLAAWTRGLTRDELTAILQQHGVPCAPVKSIREVDTDPHLIERGMIRYLDHPLKGRVPVPGCPLRLDDSPVHDLSIAEPLGTSTDEVLRSVRQRDACEPPPLQPSRAAGEAHT
jgi:crotonobetainyl-CoA:carnitine CoA-transferase CaiB-like acyl-CoA transferase